MKREELVGVWELVDCVGQSAGQEPYLPYGKSPVGQLIYTIEGRMSVHLMNRERPRFVSEDLFKASSAEIRDAFESFDSYAGTWKLDENSDVVEHRIFYCRVPNWIGETRKRHCRTDGGVLSLTTEEFEMRGCPWTVTATWKRSG